MADISQVDKKYPLVIRYKYINKLFKYMDEKNIFSTRDLILAATLVTHKFLMIGLDYQIEGGQKRPVGYFKFEMSPELEDTRRRFSQGMLTVEPKLFMTQIHGLKAEVENIHKNPHTNNS